MYDVPLYTFQYQRLSKVDEQTRHPRSEKNALIPTNVGIKV